MCQVGVRCYADSNSKLKAENKRLADVNQSIEVCREEMNAAAKSNDFEAFSQARKNLSSLKSKKDKIVFERNSAQRDVDGTKKGRALLEKAMMESKSYKEFEVLKLRKQQGEATAFVRAYSAQLKASGKQSPIFLPGEKKPSRRVAA